MRRFLCRFQPTRKSMLVSIPAFENILYIALFPQEHNQRCPVDMANCAVEHCSRRSTFARSLAVRNAASFVLPAPVPRAPPRRFPSPHRSTALSEPAPFTMLVAMSAKTRADTAIWFCVHVCPRPRSSTDVWMGQANNPPTQKTTLKKWILVYPEHVSIFQSGYRRVPDCWFRCKRRSRHML